MKLCPVCDGTGVVIVELGGKRWSKTCPRCKGTGLG